MKKLACTALLVISGALLAKPAAAEFLLYDGMGHKSVVTIALNGSQAGPFYAGEIDWLWQGTPPAGFEQAIYTYCVDPFNSAVSPQWVNPKDTEFMVVDGVVDADAGGRAAWLFNTFAPAIRAGGSDIEAAGLQVAIWEAVHDADNNLAGGEFGLIVNSSVWGGQIMAAQIRDQAQAYLDQVFYAPNQFYTSSAVWLDATPTGQDQITRVPEPGTLMLFGLAAPYALFKRRRTN